MNKLKNKFDDFYAEYGCYLWTIVTIQALSLLFLTTIDAIYNIVDAVNDLFDYEMGDVPYCICVVIYHIVVWIPAMLTQLSCLIFGWIRYRRDSK